MRLVTTISTLALVLAPVAGLAQAQGNTNDQPSVVDKAMETITGHSSNKGDDRAKRSEDSAAKKASETNYPDWSHIKKTDK